MKIQIIADIVSIISGIAGPVIKAKIIRKTKEFLIYKFLYIEIKV